jgi:hypothetical protein
MVAFGPFDEKGTPLEEEYGSWRNLFYFSRPAWNLI